MIGPGRLHHLPQPTAPTEPVKLALVGAGSRGSRYAQFARENPGWARIVAVAEPNDTVRERLGAEHGVSPSLRFRSWQDLINCPRVADAAIVATQDRDHCGPVLALARLGYHLLLEKPMSPDEGECERMAEAVERHGIVLAVCHVLRYTPYTTELKRLIDGGQIGEIVSIEHLEPVGFWHQAHSFVRGPWRRADESSPMILAKSCHDLDWIRYLMGVRCLKVASFGSLFEFRRERRPSGAADRCVDCSVEAQCPYSALRIYLRRVERGEVGWPVDVLSPSPTRESVLDAIRTGPYGRCVWGSDNDVVDHQVVAMEFAGGQTASFTMCAFTPLSHRQTRIFGTGGMITGDGEKLSVYRFCDEQTRVVDTRSAGASLQDGHGGGDEGLMRCFVAAVAAGEPGLIRSDARESLETHRIAFAAERARVTGNVQPVS